MTADLASIPLCVLVEDETTARAVLAGGAPMLQLRAKGLSDRDLLARAEAIAALCRAAGALFVVNDRPDIARLAGADGVHLGQDDLPPPRAREILGPGRLVGASAHSRPEIEAALAAGADYLGIGTIYPTGTKPALAGQGLDIVRTARSLTALPFFAIGGITLDRLPEVLAAGAPAVAVAAAITRAPDPTRATRDFLRRGRG